MTDRAPSLRPWLAIALALSIAVAAVPAGAVDRDKGAGEGLVGVPVFYNVDPIVLPVVVGNSVPRQVGILLTIEMAKGHKAEEASAKQRQLTDAFITELYRIYGWRSGARRVVSERLIKERLLIAADRVLGKGVVDAILIRQLIEQDR